MDETVVKRDLATIDAEIAETKQALANVHGSETEVYARIVGYYRAVRNWNKGKRDEFNHRKMFSFKESKDTAADSDNDCECVGKIETPVHTTGADVSPIHGNVAGYEFYARKTCPNCPPVKAYLATLNLTGTVVDVDTKDGLSEAALKGVFAAPTVIFYDAQGTELSRAHNVDELSTVFEPIAIAG